ncbi:glycosyl hydrolase [Micromonospora purpureochromogenes]|uniref:glucan endo-1,3-beta-D-glucosidase n=1 Tax=Micromonospora purpureochromogenes TaxID=47872 RepID=A0ABX2RKZ9_9ACTN|nr:glycosyl hydrolase [Micromonospora purpureochromogenes]NYF55839.1 endoglucanase Acf2 [Micromonospora purpureochromogenes]
MNPPVPPRRTPWVLATTTALAVVVAGLALTAATAPAEAATVGAGSYTTDRVGPLPTGCGDLSTNPRQFVTANAPAGPIPTNDWWSSLLWKRTNCAYSEPLHAHPASYQPFGDGLGFSATSTPTVTGTATGVGEYKYAYAEDIRVGVTGLGAPVVKVDDWTDWTVSPYWSDGTRTLRATIGHGLPFAYFRTSGGDALINPTGGSPTVWSQNGATIGFTVRGHDYVAYAPTGATWTVAGGRITSTLAGKGYFSVALLPTTPSTDATARADLATTYGRYAHAHVTGTRVSYSYDQASSRVTTTYAFTTTPREGTATQTVVSLYPHQWKALTGATPIGQTYPSARGRMKVLTGVSQFRTAMTYQGVLPELPAVATGAGADLAQLRDQLAAVRGNPMDQRGTDTYWTGKGLGRAARIAEIADLVGDTETRTAALNAIRSTLNDWFTATPGKTARVFYYDRNWGTLIGYPASYGSDQELNDHHFHYGYFIAAAATLAKFDPAWATTDRYGGMVDLLIRDANNYSREDTRFPYLRDFDIYAGHDWASGHGSFAAGNNQESSSEGMNFANALIQWGQATGNTAVRDAGMFMYTNQAAAIQQYWFDVDDENFPAAFGHSTVGMVWGDGGAYSTWFSADPEMIQGINMLPVTGGHLYLGYRPAYPRTNYAELVRNNGGEPTVWQDILWQFLALGDPDAALTKLRANPGYTPEEGESRAHTFHWIRNLAALGQVDTAVTANHPLAAVFTRNGARTYVASNITAAPLTVTWSDGTRLTVAAGRTATTGAYTWSGGNANGGASPSPTPTSPTPSPTPTSPSPTPTTPPPSGSPTRYLLPGGGLGAAGGATTTTVASAGGTNHDGTPTNPVVFTASGLTMAYSGGQTRFDLFLDAGSAVGNGVQARISYDLTGDGSVDRVETYRYFATDPVPGYEHYTQNAGLLSATGALGNLSNGTVKVEVWSAIGTNPTTLGIGDRSVVTLPYA